jgi:hypothetical protein
MCPAGGGKASFLEPCQGEGRAFESRRPLQEHAKLKIVVGHSGLRDAKRVVRKMNVRRRSSRGRPHASLALSARRCGALEIHFTYVSSIERGRRNLSLQNLLRLAAALDIDPAELARGSRPG